MNFLKGIYVMNKKVIIADISSIKVENKIFGHYGKVALMYKKMLKNENFDFFIAGGPIYKNSYKEINCLELPYDYNLDKLSNKIGKVYFKMHSTLNGIKLFFNAKNSIVICQPYSFISWMLSILFASRTTDIYLIEYRNELNKSINKLMYFFARKKIKGVICSSDDVGKAYGLPYIVVPDYIYCENKLHNKSYSPQYDFGMVGIMSNGKDIDDVIYTFSNTNYKVLIAGYFHNKERYQKILDKKTDNIEVVNKYLSNEEYEAFFDNVKYVLLPYAEYYKNASSGVIYDILFHRKPVITKDYPNFEFVKKYNIGVLYNKSLKELDFKLLNQEDFSESMQNNIDEFLIENKSCAKKIIDFIS